MRFEKIENVLRGMEVSDTHRATTGRPFMAAAVDGAKLDVGIT
jgi:hypothetical protein